MELDSGRHEPLAMDAATFRTLGHPLVDQVAGFLESLPLRPVTRDESPSAVRDAFNLIGPLPELGMDPGLLLEQTAEFLFAHSLFNGHPRYEARLDSLAGTDSFDSSLNITVLCILPRLEHSKLELREGRFSTAVAAHKPAQMNKYPLVQTRVTATC